MNASSALAWLAAVVWLLGSGAAAFEDPIPLALADAAAEVQAPAVLGSSRLHVRVVNVGAIPVHIEGVELSAARVDGSPVGRFEREGRAPDALRPGHAAQVHFRWRRGPDELRGSAGPVLLFGCVSIREIDVDPSNDCGVALRAHRPRAETSVISDAFDGLAPHWEWWSSGTGTHAVANGMAAFTVSEKSHSEEYSDAEINDYRRGPERGFPWVPGLRMEIRARTSDDNGLFSDEGRGTRGFGFWNLDTESMTTVWFISLSKETFGGLFGLFAATVFDRGRLVLLQPLTVDTREWHTYGIVWTHEGVTFTVDGAPVAATADAPSERLGFVAWIDNYRLSLSGAGIERHFLDLEIDQTLFVDQVRIWSLD